MNLPKYNSKDYYVLALVLVPVALLVSYAAMGRLLFASWEVVLTATLCAGLVLAGFFTFCSWWAVRMQQRFPQEAEVGRKLFFMITVFLLMSGLVLLFIFTIFEAIPFFNYRIDHGRFVWAYLGLGFVNIFLSFLMEGISRFEEWKANLERQEQLQRHFQYSQLQGLKTQVNPHFLFNNLNTLSSLIEEDTAAAERFLDEMSKVYRYLLRPEDEQLVALRAELRFLHAYLHLLRMRFGAALDVCIDLPDELLGQLLPPLTLQAIVEETIRSQSMSKQQPLRLRLTAAGTAGLCFSHSLNPKARTAAIAGEPSFGELIRKYQLLGQAEVTVTEADGCRIITIPFIASYAPA